MLSLLICCQMPWLPTYCRVNAVFDPKLRWTCRFHSCERGMCTSFAALKKFGGLNPGTVAVRLATVAPLENPLFNPAAAAAAVLCPFPTAGGPNGTPVKTKEGSPGRLFIKLST